MLAAVTTEIVSIDGRTVCFECQAFLRMLKGRRRYQICPNQRMSGRGPLPRTGAPCSPWRTWAEENGAQPLPTLLLCPQRLRMGREPLRIERRHWKNIVFGPCTLRRTWGTRPEPKAVIARKHPPLFPPACWTSPWLLNIEKWLIKNLNVRFVGDRCFRSSDPFDDHGFQRYRLIRLVL